MIRAMHLRVAVRATALQHHGRRRVLRQAAVGEGDTRVTGLRMTGLAEQGLALRQQRRMNRAMGFVAQAAVFTDGSVLE